MSIFALSFCEVTNKLMPKTPMGRKEGGHDFYYNHE